jgi:D-alanyl-D-alanine dipeptidase
VYKNKSWSGGNIMNLSKKFLLSILLLTISLQSSQQVNLIKFNPKITIIKLSTWLNKEPESEIETIYMTNSKMANSLNNVQKDLEKIGLGLNVYHLRRMDAYVLISPQMIDTINRNCYAFVSLIDLETQKELAMPSPIGSHSSKNDRNNKNNWTLEESKNYIVLETTMKKFGFEPLNNSWWSFKLVDNQLIS